jgi:hypothetical protein
MDSSSIPSEKPSVFIGAVVKAGTNETLDSETTQPVGSSGFHSVETNNSGHNVRENQEALSRFQLLKTVGEVAVGGRVSRSHLPLHENNRLDSVRLFYTGSLPARLTAMEFPPRPSVCEITAPPPPNRESPFALEARHH